MGIQNFSCKKTWQAIFFSEIFVFSDVIFPEEEESKSSSEKNSTSKSLLPKKPENPSRSRLFSRGDSLRIDAASKIFQEEDSENTNKLSLETISENENEIKRKWILKLGIKGKKTQKFCLPLV